MKQFLFSNLKTELEDIILNDLQKLAEKNLTTI